MSKVKIPNWHNRNKLWLNETHYIRWVTYKGEIIGGILGHTSEESVYPEGWCEGAFNFKDNLFNREHPRDGDTWEFNSDFVKPTLNPSFLCHCKACHCYVRDGKWIDAGCRH